MENAKQEEVIKGQTREEMIGMVIGNRIANLLCHSKKFYKNNEKVIKTAGAVTAGAAIAVTTGVLTV